MAPLHVESAWKRRAALRGREAGGRARTGMRRHSRSQGVEGERGVVGRWQPCVLRREEDARLTRGQKVSKSTMYCCAAPRPHAARRWRLPALFVPGQLAARRTTATVNPSYSFTRIVELSDSITTMGLSKESPSSWLARRTMLVRKPLFARFTWPFAPRQSPFMSLHVTPMTSSVASTSPESSPSIRLRTRWPKGVAAETRGSAPVSGWAVGLLRGCRWGPRGAGLPGDTPAGRRGTAQRPYSVLE